MEEKLAELVSSGEIDLVSFDPNRPQTELSAAFKHYDTAQRAIETDPEGAFILLYESARRALQAILATDSLRVRRPPHGNHFSFVKVGRLGFVNPEIWKPFDWMRNLRNQTAYLDQEKLPASEADARQALVHVAKMLEEAQSRVTKA